MLQKILLSSVLLVLAKEGLSQCYTSSDCTGGTLRADDAKDCCCETDGYSYSSDGISCSTCKVSGFESQIYYVEEGEPIDTMFVVNLKGETNFRDLIRGTITATAGGDTDSSDFETLTSILVTEIDNSVPVRLFTSNDDITLEYDDYVIITFTPENPAIIGALEAEGEYIKNTAIVNIIDIDKLRINFDEWDYLIEESGGLRLLIRFQFQSNQNPFNITICPVNISIAENMGLGELIASGSINEVSRATAGADFTDDCKEFTVPNFATGGNTYFLEDYVIVHDDDIDEVEQSFALIAILGSDVPDSFACFQVEVGDSDCINDGRRGVTRIRIRDNDRMIIGFTNRGITVSEGDTSPGRDSFQILIGVHFSRPSEVVHNIIYRHLESASTATVEFERMAGVDALFGTEAGDPIVVQRPLNPEDTFTDDRRTPSLPVEIINDFTPEDEECFSITITIFGHREVFKCNDDIGYFCTYTVCILDDDEPFEVAFVETTYTVSEDVGTVEVCVNLTKPQIDILNEFVVVEVIDFPSSVYIPADVTQATPDVPDILGRYLMMDGSDYAQQTVVTNAIDDERIGENDDELIRIVCYDQPIYDDECLEADEWLGLTLGVDRASVLTIVRPMYNQSAIVIQDKDTAVVGLEQTFFNVSESVGQVELCAIVISPNMDPDCPNCPIGFPFDVQLSTFNGDAATPMDYVSLDVILMFGICDTKQCVNVTIVDDFEDEPDENFFYTLTRPPGGLDSRITLSPTLGEILIHDNVPFQVGYDPTVYVTSESEGFVVLNIRIFEPTSGGAPGPFTLSVSTQEVTGVSPEDYVSVNGEIIQFNTGDTTKTHTIFIEQDQICETEYFSSNIVLVSGVQPIQVIRPQATITIVDTSEPECVITLSLTSENYTAPENIGSLEVCVILNAPLSFDFDIAISTTARNSATIGEDFLSPNQQFVLIFAGATEACTDIEIIDDIIVEGDEVFIVEVSSPFIPLPIDISSAIVTIIDDDKLSLTCTASGISEVTIDCEGIEDATLQCSFNSGPLYQCSVPMVLTIDVHPPGIYFIRFVSSTGDEDTVTYNITDIKTDVSPIVPKLRVNLINGSPRLIAGNTAVEAEFEVSRPVAGVRCYLRSQTARVYKNCSSGVVSFDGLKSGRYILKVHAYNRGGDVATVKSGFVINDN